MANKQAEDVFEITAPQTRIDYVHIINLSDRIGQWSKDKVGKTAFKVAGETINIPLASDLIRRGMKPYSIIREYNSNLNPPKNAAIILYGKNSSLKDGDGGLRDYTYMNPKEKQVLKDLQAEIRAEKQAPKV
jgi:hypothetical protein